MSGQPHREDDLGPDEHQSMSRATGDVADPNASRDLTASIRGGAA